jgi:hypothetical protein
MAETDLSLGKDGYFSRAGSRFIPVGVNYSPATSGHQMWQLWPADIIQHDLDTLLSLEFNTVRFFLNWADFEPAAGQWNAEAFSRLEQLLSWCADRNLCAQPTLFTASHGHSATPAWGKGRNFFADATVRDRAIAFAAETARIVAPYHDHLISIDVGHQLSRLSDNLRAAPAIIDHWCRSIRSAIQSTYPAALITCGNSIDTLLHESPWRPADSTWSYQTVHGSMLPSHHPVTFDGLTDPLGQSLLPLYTEMARTSGPVLLQDLATLPTLGVSQQEAFLETVLPACWAAGANGFLWNAMFDGAHPGTIGLLDENGQLKPCFRHFVEFAQSTAELPAPRFAANYIGLYLPKAYCSRDGSSSPSDRSTTSRFLATAHYHLRAGGNEVHLVRGDRPIHPRTRRIFIAGAELDDSEIAALTAWVTAGGHLSWHGPNPEQWNAAYQHLISAVAVDFRTPKEAIVSWAGAEWKVEHYPGNIRLEVEPVDAEVLATDQTGFPVVLRHRLGNGTVICALPQIDHAVSSSNLARRDRDRCTQWYRAMVAQ